METVEEKFLRAVKEHTLFVPGDHIILGLSGGADSLALFSLLVDFCRNRIPVTVHPVHVNHKIRKEAADADQLWVEKLCENYGLHCRSEVFDCVSEAQRQNLTEEEAGRKKRYRSFDEAAEELEKSGIEQSRIKIATAHHADDQAETILLHLLRGSGVDGLAGMAYSRTDLQGYSIIRPLLDCRKAELREYGSRHGLVPREDQTNSDPSYGRNRIRLELIPYLKTYNPKIAEALIRLGKSAEEDRKCLQDQAGKLYLRYSVQEVDAEGQKAVSLRQKETAALPEALRIRVLKNALIDAGLNEDFTAHHLQAADHVLCGRKPSARADLPHGFTVRREYGQVIISRAFGKGESSKYDAQVEQPVGTVRTADADALPEELPKGTYAFFDLEKLQAVYGPDAGQKVVLRCRRPGDFIAVRGGRKKIQDVLVDDKVPKIRRDSILLAAVGSEVLFLPAWDPAQGRGRYSSSYVVGPDTKKAVIVEINCRI